MSIETALARIGMLQSALLPPLVSPAPSSATPPPATTSPPGASTFASALQQASAGAALPVGGSSPGAGIAATARGEVGQVEQPPGSNDSSRISQYRAAVPGGPVGPWCAYFASWVARQNGTPLGENGQGFARVDDVWAWAQRSSRAVPAGSAASPRPGDLIIWDEHMGIVESVGPDGSVRTIEGNSSDSVAQRSYGPDGGGAVGYVRMS